MESELNFSDVVGLIMNKTGLGYAKAAAILDKAIEPQIKEVLDRETKKAIDNYFKDKAVFTEFECEKHGTITPSRIMPECPQCLVELTGESKR